MKAYRCPAEVYWERPKDGGNITYAAKLMAEEIIKTFCGLGSVSLILNFRQFFWPPRLGFLIFFPPIINIFALLLMEIHY